MKALAAALVFVLAQPAARRRREPPPPPPVTVRLTQGATRDLFVVSLENTSPSPVRVYVDRFLLGFELRPEGRRGPVRRCAPPAGLAPRRIDTQSIRTLRPGMKHEEQVDVRFFCWGASQRFRKKAHTVVAKYGKRGRASMDRWVVSSEDGTTGHHAQLVSEPVSVPALPPPEKAPPGTIKRGIELSARDGQATSGREVILALSLVNHGPDPVHVFLHPFEYRFKVTSAQGEVACAVHEPERNPPREDFARLARRARRNTRLDIAQLCPAGTFSKPGVYEVIPELVLGHNGVSASLQAFTGTVRAEPVTVRITRGHGT